MKVTLMCAVPHLRMDYGPSCTDGRGGQIYHNATPGFIVKNPSSFCFGVAASFLLEYERDERQVSHLAYVAVTARLNGEVIGNTRNDFVLNPFAPRPVGSLTSRRATYENIPLSVECSARDVGLIELSMALKVDTYADPIDVIQTVYVRSLTLPDGDDRISPEEFDRWLIQESSARLEKCKKRAPSPWRNFLRA